MRPRASSRVAGLLSSSPRAPRRRGRGLPQSGAKTVFRTELPRLRAPDPTPVVPGLRNAAVASMGFPMILDFPYRGRLAPSPTGFPHLGHARTFWTAQQRARAAGGVLVLRNEDLDAERIRADFTAAMIEDLRWFGLAWQEGPERWGTLRPLQPERAARPLCRGDRGAPFPRGRVSLPVFAPRCS